MSVKLSNMMHSSNSVKTLSYFALQAGRRIFTSDHMVQVPLVYCYKSTSAYVIELIPEDRFSRTIQKRNKLQLFSSLAFFFIRDC